MVLNDVMLNIRAVIKRKGLKHRYIADQLNITAQAVSDLLHGRRTLTVALLLRLAEILDVDIVEFFS